MNEEALYKTINDERTYSETFYTTYTGSIIPRITGPISAVSSALIIFIILRSNVKLTTIYHRLIFGMSIADVISSIAMACSTVPMPKDMVYKQIQGTVLGNIQTCEAQGFIMTYGLCISFSYNFVLCTYYLCSINWKMTEATIRKRVEPFFHFVAIIISLGPALISLLANVSWSNLCIPMISYPLVSHLSYEMIHIFLEISSNIHWCHWTTFPLLQ